MNYYCTLGKLNLDKFQNKANNISLGHIGALCEDCDLIG